MTGVIGAFVVLACAATLHTTGSSVDDAGDAAAALEPLAGGGAILLFGAGLLGAALLAASILPLSTAYPVGEARTPSSSSARRSTRCFFRRCSSSWRGWRATRT